MNTTERGQKIILELSSWRDRPFEVQRQRFGYSWETVARYTTKAAAFYRAELVQSETDDSVRVIKAVLA